MSYYIHINGKAVREYKSYNAAVNNAIAKARPGRDIYLTRDGDVVPVLKVGDMAMSQNVMLKVVGIHAAGVDLSGSLNYMDIEQRNVDPATLRTPGSDASQAFYCEHMQNKLEAEKPSRDLCRKIIAALRVQRVDSAVSPIELEGNSRIDGFISAIEQYMSR